MCFLILTCLLFQLGLYCLLYLLDLDPGGFFIIRIRNNLNICTTVPGLPAAGEAVDHGPHQEDHERGRHEWSLLQGGALPGCWCFWWGQINTVHYNADPAGPQAPFGSRFRVNKIVEDKFLKRFSINLPDNGKKNNKIIHHMFKKSFLLLLHLSLH